MAAPSRVALGDSLNLSRARQLDRRAHTDLINIISLSIWGGTLGSVLGDTAIDVQGTVMDDNYTTGQAGAVGPISSSANNTFNQVWSQNAASVDLDALAAELATVRAEMRKRAGTPQDDLALAEIGEAQVAASEKDGPRAIEHLAKAGKWALGCDVDQHRGGRRGDQCCHKYFTAAGAAASPVGWTPRPVHAGRDWCPRAGPACRPMRRAARRIRFTRDSY